MFVLIDAKYRRPGNHFFYIHSKNMYLSKKQFYFFIENKIAFFCTNKVYMYLKGQINK